MGTGYDVAELLEEIQNLKKQLAEKSKGDSAKDILTRLRKHVLLERRRFRKLSKDGSSGLSREDLGGEEAVLLSWSSSVAW